jgi:hypothetical protein
MIEDVGIANKWLPDIITTYMATVTYTVISDIGSPIGYSINYPNTTATLVDLSAFIKSWEVYNGQTFYTLNIIPGADSSSVNVPVWWLRLIHSSRGRQISKGACSVISVVINAVKGGVSLPRTVQPSLLSYCLIKDIIP